MPLSTRTAVDLLQDFFTNVNNTSTKLDLSSCNLSSLPSIFETLIDEHPQATNRLTLLNLAHNNLTALPSYLNRLTKLRILFLLRNDFESIPQVISEMTSVTMLSFKENKLKGELQAKKLPPFLNWLILTSNQITSLSNDFGVRCHRIRKLMLSNNLLSSLPKNLSSQMPSLELLRLANNKFTTFPSDVLNFPKITWLALAGNPVLCDDIDDNTNQLPKEMHINDINTEYKVDWNETPLGSGASGTAYAGVHRTSNTSVVVKQFRSMAGSDGRSIDEVELSCMATGIPHLIHALSYSFNDGLYLITKRVQGNPYALAGPPSFDSCVRSVYSHELRMSSHDKLNVIDCIQQAVNGLHEMGICHGDVYGHNILISSLSSSKHENDSEKKLEATLADLGAAWKIPSEFKQKVIKMERRALDILKSEIMALAET